MSAVDCGAFARAGYVLLPGLVPASRASRLAGHYLAVRKSAAADGDAGSMDRHDRLLQVHLRDAESRWLAHHAPLVDAVATLLDDDPLLAKTIVYFKPPGARGVALHQDERFFPLTPLVSAVVALDACDQENGGLRVVPGSHIGGLLPVEEDDPSRSILTHRTALGDRVGDVGIDMRPGDVLLMHGALVHGSAPNQSLDRFRRSVLCIFTGHRTAGFSDLLVQLAERAAASPAIAGRILSEPAREGKT